jgi:hypothetical protein
MMPPTGAVLDHHLLPQARGEPLAHQARQDVGGAAGRVAHDPADRPVGIVGLGDGRQREDAAQQDKTGDEFLQRTHHGS